MKKLILMTLFFLPTFANADEWKIVQDKSKLSFKVLQNNSQINGYFKNFSGKINFDPTQLKTSKVDIDVDLTSLTTSVHDATTTLPTNEWLATKTFPQAHFSANQFTKVDGKKYVANGYLTLKGKNVPCNLNFTLDEYSATKARALGNVTIKRSDFAIGAKNPDNAHGVKDEVEVNFIVEAIK